MTDSVASDLASEATAPLDYRMISKIHHRHQPNSYTHSIICSLLLRPTNTSAIPTLLSSNHIPHANRRTHTRNQNDTPPNLPLNHMPPRLPRKQPRPVQINIQ